MNWQKVIDAFQEYTDNVVSYRIGTQDRAGVHQAETQFMARLFDAVARPRVDIATIYTPYTANTEHREGSITVTAYAAERNTGISVHDPDWPGVLARRVADGLGGPEFAVQYDHSSDEITLYWAERQPPPPPPYVPGPQPTHDQIRAFIAKLDTMLAWEHYHLVRCLASYYLANEAEEIPF